MCIFFFVGSFLLVQSVYGEYMQVTVLIILCYIEAVESIISNLNNRMDSDLSIHLALYAKCCFCKSFQVAKIDN